MIRCATATLMLALVASCAYTAHDRPIIRRLELRGVHNVSPRALRRGLASKPAPWWRRGPQTVFEPMELERDRTRVQRFYEANGYFATKIVVAEARPRARGQDLDVLIAVEEGPPTFIGDLRVMGLSELDPETRQRMNKEQLGLRRGQVFQHDDYLAFKARLLRVLVEHGYGMAEVRGNVDVQSESNLAHITLTFSVGARASQDRP